jgi:formate dehydrogenase subunit gamma
MSRFLNASAAALLAGALLAGSAFAQSNSSAPAGGGSTTTTPAPRVVPDDPVPGGTAPGGIQGQNIFDVKPEVKRDASSEPGYDKQTNGQRNAVQPGNNAPMWRGVQRGMEGFTTIPKSQDYEAGVLMQGQVQYPGSRMTTAGQAWREVRNGWILPYGGALLLIVLAALVMHYFGMGPIGQHHPDTGRKIERFTPFERASHWANAIAFVLLGISGIVMAFGKFFLLPIIGQTLFGYFTYILKNVHNFAGPLFAVSLVIMIVGYARDNLPQRGDMGWLVRFGGFFGGKHGEEPPSNKYNAGEKMMFWSGVFLLGLVVVGSGLVLDKLVPNLLYERSTMQVANMVHAIASVLMLAMFFGHIYLGTLGMRGAYSAMRTGYVDEEWAKEHHRYWYEDIKAGKIPAQRSKPLVIVDDTQTVRTV